MIETRNDLIEEYLLAQRARQENNKTKCINNFDNAYKRALDEGKNHDGILEFKLNHLLITWGLNLENNRLKYELLFTLICQLAIRPYNKWLELLIIDVDKDNSCIQNYKAEITARINKF